jgi:hypothetical protein
LTHPRNYGRKDLGCPFGCKESHRKKKSTERSVAYYREEKGKEKKKEHNNKRNRQKCSASSNDLPEENKSSSATPEIVPPPLMLPYLVTVTSLIERRRVRVAEIFELLNYFWRQHPPDKTKKRLYLYKYHREKPR